MRRTILAGLILAAATVVTIMVGAALDLDLEPVALLGLATGAIIALVPDGSPARRVAGFALGFAAAFVGYLMRAAIMPDTSTGRAIAAGVVVLLCVGVVAISVGRLPLWAALLGTASLAGAYELTYAAAPPRVLDTSVSTGTALLLCVAVGFLAAAVIKAEPTREDDRGSTDPDATPINDMMETSK